METIENGQTLTIQEEQAKPPARKKPRTHSYKTELRQSQQRERKWKLTALAASSLALMEAVVYWVMELMS